MSAELVCTYTARCIVAPAAYEDQEQPYTSSLCLVTDEKMRTRTAHEEHVLQVMAQALQSQPTWLYNRLAPEMTGSLP